jgi:hypothetical protein
MIIILYVWIGPDTSVIKYFMYASFVFCLLEEGHVIGQNL